MTAAARFALVAALLLLGGACESTKPPPPPPPKDNGPVVPPADKDDIENHITKLCNPSSSERWRDGLIELSERTTAHTRLVNERLVTEYRASRARRSITLNEAGRARAVFVLGRVGDGFPESEEVISEALDDPGVDVRIASAEIYARRGDDSVLPNLLEATTKVSGEAATALQSVLKLFAQPERREAFLDALEFSNLELLSPVIDATIPSAQKTQVLTELVEDSDSAPVVAYAARALAVTGTVAALPALRRSVERFDGEPALRAEVYAAVEQLAKASGGREVVDFFEAELRRGPPEPQVVAGRLLDLRSAEALPRAVAMLKDDDVPDTSRAALLEAAVARVDRLRSKEPLAEAARRLIDDDEDALRLAAVRALGRFGDLTTDADLLLQRVVNADDRDDLGAAIVRSLAVMSGERASRNLVLILSRYDDLRAETVKVLSTRPKAELPLETLVDLLDSSKIEVREAAYEVLRRTVSDRVTFDANADKDLREKAIRDWRKAIK